MAQPPLTEEEQDLFWQTMANLKRRGYHVPERETPAVKLPQVKAPLEPERN